MDLNIEESSIYNIALALTNKCNLNCVWCFEDAGMQKKEVIDKNIAKRIVKKASELGGVKVFNFTGGEPLLVPWLKEAVYEARQAFPIVNVTSNSLLLNDEWISFLAKNEIRLTTSIDGSKEIHDSIRGPNAFVFLTKNVGKCVKAGVKVSLQMTISKFNYHSLDEVIAIARELGVDRLNILPMRRIGRGNNLAELVLSADENNALVEKVISLQREGVKISFNHPIANTVSQKLINSMNSNAEDCVCGGCRAGFGGLFIDWKGDVFPCPFLRIKLGNIIEQNVKDFWNTSQILMKLRDKTQYGKCGSCDYWRICRGCRADALIETSNVTGDDPSCWQKV